MTNFTADELNRSFTNKRELSTILKKLKLYPSDFATDQRGLQAYKDAVRELPELIRNRAPGASLFRPRFFQSPKSPPPPKSPRARSHSREPLKPHIQSQMEFLMRYTQSDVARMNPVTRAQTLTKVGLKVEDLAASPLRMSLFRLYPAELKEALGRGGSVADEFEKITSQRYKSEIRAVTRGAVKTAAKRAGIAAGFVGMYNWLK